MSEQRLRKACDRCHKQKLSCPREGASACARCIKANAQCKTSPSLRHKSSRQVSEPDRTDRQQRHPESVGSSSSSSAANTVNPGPELDVTTVEPLDDLTFDNPSSFIPRPQWLSEQEKSLHGVYSDHNASNWLESGQQSRQRSQRQQKQQPPNDGDADMRDAVSAAPVDPHHLTLDMLDTSIDASTFAMHGPVPDLWLTPKTWDASGFQTPVSLNMEGATTTLGPDAAAIAHAVESQAGQAFGAVDFNKRNADRFTEITRINVELYTLANSISEHLRRGSNSADIGRRTTQLQAFKPTFEKVLKLCFQLVDVLYELSVQPCDAVGQHSPSSLQRRYHAAHSPGATETRSIVDSVDSASALMLSSCYLRLLDSYADLLSMVTDELSTSSPSTHYSKDLSWLEFPAVLVGNSSLDAYPGLKMSLGLELVERTTQHIGSLLKPGDRSSSASSNSSSNGIFTGNSDGGNDGRRRFAQGSRSSSTRSDWRDQRDLEGSSSSSEIPIQGISIREERVMSLIRDVRSQLLKHHL